MTTDDECNAPGFHEQLLEIYTDPRIRRFALRRAHDVDLAEDAMQETYYSVSRVREPERIRDLRAFFCRALAHEIDHQRGNRRPIPAEEPALVAAAGADGFFGAAPVQASVEGTAIWLVLTTVWLKPFRCDRARLQSRVAGRSADADRYRQVIVAIAEQILGAAAASCVSWADSNEAMQAAYPEWLDERDCDPVTIYQRLSRARQGVRLLLKSVVDRRELSPLSSRGRAA